MKVVETDEHRIRTAVVPVRLRRADYQRAHDAAHISAGLWVASQIRCKSRGTKAPGW